MVELRSRGLGEQNRTGDGTKTEINEREIHDILRNWRRRKVIEELRASVGPVALRDLAETLAAAESGQSPPPRNVRKSVYNSLHQTHLPKLAEAGVVEYDTDRKTVTLEQRAHEVGLYMEVVTKYGITWATYYRRLLLLALLTVIGSEIGVPVLADIQPLVLVSAFLAVVVASTTYQLWSDRWRFIRPLVD
jgi:hypothetical protein